MRVPFIASISLQTAAERKRHLSLRGAETPPAVCRARSQPHLRHACSKWARVMRTGNNRKLVIVTLGGDAYPDWEAQCLAANYQAIGSLEQNPICVPLSNVDKAAFNSTILETYTACARARAACMCRMQRHASLRGLSLA